MKLLTTGNYKTVKGEKLGVLTGILYLAPAKISGYEVCPRRSPGCTSACLFTAGMGAFSTVQHARINKTKQYFEARDAFKAQLEKDIKALVKKAKKLNMKPAVRLNGTSDINWMGSGIMDKFPEVQFYDYTKVLNRLEKDIPKNYNITFSRSEINDADCRWALELGFNVAVVFKTLPQQYMGRQVINGDETDVRFADAKGVVIGLTAKGKARKDNSGFVVSSN
jgi:Gene product 88